VSQWRNRLTVHPAAEVFPPLSKAELQELADDIRKNGLLEGVTLWFNPATEEEELLDGRNRLDALELLGDPIFNSKGAVRKEWLEKTYLTGIDPASYVIGRNIRRRHLTKRKQAELIVAAVKAGKLDRANPARSIKGGGGRGGARGSTRDPVKAQVLEEAKKAGISERTATQALVDAEPARKRSSNSKPKPIDELQAVLFELIEQNAAALAKLGHGRVTIKTTVTFADGTMIERKATHD
jgi:ParB-like chromosome segregation protein Spo0J